VTRAEPAPLDVATPRDLVELRRDLHRHPELRFAERRTAALMAERLTALGYAVRTGLGGTGVTGTLDAGAPGAHVVLRADMDALPVQDAKDVPWASSVDGVAHACGHDVHMVVALGVAARLAATPPAVGRVTLVFQPAEERPFGQPSGAQAMLDDGALAGAPPDAVLGVHCWPDLPAGTVGVDERIAMAAKDAFRITLRGRPAHAATPSRGRDAVLGIAQVVTALHQGVARALDARDLAAFNVGTIRGGSSQSVVAAEAEVTGSLRTAEPQVRARLRETVERTVAGVATALGLDPDLRWADEMPPIVNDPRLVRRALEVGNRLPGPDRARLLTVPPMTADDFALLGQLGPALYLKLGVRGEAADWPPLHSGLFDVDERAIGVGTAVLHALAADVLARPLRDGEA
jgi:amidohydrolase